MCPLKREQATRVSYNTLTHSRLNCIEIGRKVGHELNKPTPWVKKVHSQMFLITNFHNVSLAYWQRNLQYSDRQISHHTLNMTPLPYKTFTLEN